MSIPRTVLAKYIKAGCEFRECGSRWGDTLIKAIELGAARAMGCESDTLYAIVGHQHVSEACPKQNAIIYNLDSLEFLKCTKSTNAVVFLDAHTEFTSHVLEELGVISTWDEKPTAILIDDMRCMAGWGIEPALIYSKLGSMGYKMKWEDGVAPKDILVAVP